MKTKQTLTAILSAAVLTSSAYAAPFGPDIPVTTNFWGKARGCNGPDNTHYEAHFNSAFGGEWSLRGVHQTNPDGSLSDTINGQISDTTISGSFYDSDAMHWNMEAPFLCGAGWIQATQFLLIISNGSVHGYAVYY